MRFSYTSLFLLLCLSFQSVFSQNVSNQAEISVITCGPGNELYSTFGHTAIRVKDPVYRFDKVYNYGTFNFETPNFYLKFSRGQLDYMLSVSPYRFFVASYKNENRWIKEQVLNLTNSQMNEIYQFLENNALPDNKYYRYDFFFDNCATRVKDVLKEVLGDNLSTPEKITEDGLTFRDMLKPYLIGKNWERLGINLALGQPADKVVTADQATFIPDFTELYFDECLVKVDNKEVPLVQSTNMIFEPEEELMHQNSFLNPLLLFCLVFFVYLVFSIIEIRNKKYYILIDKALFFLAGIAGLIISLLWFATDHKAVINNWDIIWAMPVYLIISFLIQRNGKQLFARFFLFIWSCFLTIALLLSLFIYPYFDYAIIPLIITLILRSQLFFFYRK